MESPGRVKQKKLRIPHVGRDLGNFLGLTKKLMVFVAVILCQGHLLSCAHSDSIEVWYSIFLSYNFTVRKGTHKIFLRTFEIASWEGILKGPIKSFIHVQKWCICRGSLFTKTSSIYTSNFCSTDFILSDNSNPKNRTNASWASRKSCLTYII